MFWSKSNGLSDKPENVLNGQTQLPGRNTELSTLGVGINICLSCSDNGDVNYVKMLGYMCK